MQPPVAVTAEPTGPLADLRTLTRLTVELSRLRLTARGQQVLRNVRGLAVRYGVPNGRGGTDWGSASILGSVESAELRVPHESVHALELTPETLPALAQNPLRFALVGSEEKDIATGTLVWTRVLFEERRKSAFAVDLRDQAKTKPTLG